MARFEITAPDGSRFEVTAPDDASESDVMAYARQQYAAAPQGQQRSKAYDGWGDYGKDLARTITHGATLGFGDEIIAGARAALSDATYDETLSEERAANKRFREHNPGTALAAELVGGFAVPGLGAGRAIAAARSTPQAMATGARYGAGYGTVGGFGVGEDGFSNRMRSAATGLQWGTAIGAGLPAVQAALRPAAQAADSTLSRAVGTLRDDEDAARQYLADRLRQAGLTEADIARDLQRGQQARQFNARSIADLPETIADASPVTQRVLRGIKVGGDADDVIEGTLGARQASGVDFARQGQAAGQVGRVRENIRQAMNVSGTRIADDVRRVETVRGASANENFRAAFANSEPFDLGNTLTRYALEAQNLTHPGQRAKLVEALRLFDPHGYVGADLYDEVARRLQRMDGRIARAQLAGRDTTEAVVRRQEMADDLNRRLQQRVASASTQKRVNLGVNTVERFQRAKEALDDLLGSSGVREQRNLYRLLARLKHDLLSDVAGGDRANPTRNARYFEALQDYATRSELVEAAAFGRAVATGKETLTPAIWRGMNRAEQTMARKAYTQVLQRKMGGKAQGQATDSTALLRTPNVQDDLRVMLPPQAGRSEAFPGGNRERLAELTRREARMTDTTRKVLGNSTTAEKAVDAIDVGRLARVARYIRDHGGPMQATVTALSEQLERFGAVKGRRARYLARQLLSTDPAEQAQFLAEVRRTYGRARADRIAQAVEHFTVSWERGIAATGARYGAEDERAR